MTSGAPAPQGKLEGLAGSWHSALPACLQGVVPAVMARDAGLGVALAFKPSLPRRTFRQIPRCLYQSGPIDWASEEAGKFRSIEFIRNVSTSWTRPMAPSRHPEL